MLCDCVVEGMKCGITDRSAGSSDMVDGSRMWFTHRGSIGIETESSESFGQQARTQPRGEAVIYSWGCGVEGIAPVLQPIHAAAVTVRRCPAAERGH